MLRWALFQFLIGNSDAHGKNFSFFVRPGGLLEPALVRPGQRTQYDGFEDRAGHGLRRRVPPCRGYPAFALADFAARCGIDRKLMRREGQRWQLATTEAAAQAQAADYESEAERVFVQGIADFVARQADRLTQLVADAALWKDEYL